MPSFARPIALVLLVVAASSASARADAPLDLRLPTPPLERSLFQQELEHRAHNARVLRNAGIVTTVVGTVVNLIGVGVLMSNLCLSDSGSCPGRSDAAATAGLGLIGIGYGAIFAGIPMWAVGGTRLKHAEAELGFSATGVVGRF
jgi:hypothetical protein